MNVILSFATEESGMNFFADIQKEIADFLYDNGLRGNFHLTGDYARGLRKLGRRDVIKSLARHEIGYHCNHHGARPFMGGYCESDSWKQSVATWLEEEMPGFKIVEELFERAPVYYTSEFVKAPQVVYGAWLTGMRSIGFMRGGPENKAPLPNAGRGAAWFCNMFVPSSHDLFHGLDEHKDIFQEQVGRLQKSPGVLRYPIHMYQVVSDRKLRRELHAPGTPSQYRDNIHYEDYFKQLENILLPPAERAEALMKCKNTIKTVADQAGCRFIGYEDYRKLYHPGAGQWLKISDMDALAEQLKDTLDAVILGPVSVSPAEAFGLFTRVLRVYHETGAWPERVALRSLIGPVEEAPCINEEENHAVNPRFLFQKTTAIDRELDDTGYLPCEIEGDDVKLGPGNWLCAMRELYRRLRAYGESGEPLPCDAPALPAVAADPFFQETRFQHNIRGVKLYPEDFTGEHICRLGRLQSWSWKPAVLI